VKFISRGSGYTLFITPRDAVLALSVPEPPSSSKPDVFKPQRKRNQRKESVIRMRLEGADSNTVWNGAEPMEGKANYFIGGDRSQWRTDIALYAQVKARNIYPGIDMEYYGSQKSLEYDFVVNPGADPGAIQITYEGAGRCILPGPINVQNSPGLSTRRPGRGPCDRPVCGEAR
jgi:hypothetical protein